MSSTVTAEAQGRYRERVVIVRPYRPFRSFRPYGYGYRPYGYPYGSFSPYSHYVFSSNEAAENQGYHDGLKTGSEEEERIRVSILRDRTTSRMPASATSQKPIETVSCVVMRTDTGPNQGAG